MNYPGDNDTKNYRQKVEVDTLVNFSQENAIKHNSLLKIDTEGYDKRINRKHRITKKGNNIL